MVIKLGVKMSDFSKPVARFVDFGARFVDKELHSLDKISQLLYVFISVDKIDTQPIRHCDKFISLWETRNKRDKQTDNRLAGKFRHIRKHARTEPF